MGHRYYREEDIGLLKTVKTLKDEGFQLKAIKMLLPDISKIDSFDPQSILGLREELNQKAELENGEDIIDTKNGTGLMLNHEDAQVEEVKSNKMEQFRDIMNDLIGNALKENNTAISDTVSVAVSNSVIKEMDYLLRLKEEREEERYKKFDETVRNLQKYRLETAATKEEKGRKKSKFFRKNKKVKPI
jgi:DNA-binding transcriptional MerR regulator